MLPAAAALLLTVLAVPARAQDYGGRWTSSSARESVSVESWGAACGTRPAPTTSPGGAVTISSAGAHLSISGAHAWRTNSCWRRDSALQRRSTSATATSWRTVCATPPNDPRTERGEYTLRAVSADRLEFRSVTVYDWSIDDSHCRVRMVATRSYTRAATGARPTEPTPREPTPAEPASPRQPAAPRGPACEPGAPARIITRPRELRLGPSERRCIQARVVDAAGCAVPRAPIAWSLSSPEQLGGILSDDGCFTPDESAGEASVVAIVRSGTLSAQVPIRVSSNDLLAITATSLEPESEAPGEHPARPGEARGVRADVEDAEPDRAVLYAALAAMSALALLLGGVAIVLWRRAGARRSRRVERRSSAPSAAPELRASLPVTAAAPTATPPPRAEPAPAAAAERPAGPELAPRAGGEPSTEGLVAAAATAAAGPSDGPMVCPACQQEFEAGSGFCPFDGSRLVQAEAAQRPGNVCPACHRGFDAAVKQCPHDAEELVPQPLWEATRRAPTAPSEPPPGEGGKICPTCACRYDVDATFCGRDGSPLVLVN